MHLSTGVCVCVYVCVCVCARKSACAGVHDLGVWLCWWAGMC